MDWEGGSEPVCWDLSSLCGQLLWDSLPEPSWPPEAAGKWRRYTPAVSLAAAPHHSSVLTRVYWRLRQLLIADVQKHPAVSHLRVKLKWCIQLHVLFTTCNDKNAPFICSHYEREYRSHLFVFLMSTFKPVECPYWTLKTCLSRHITRTAVWVFLGWCCPESHSAEWTATVSTICHSNNYYFVSAVNMWLSRLIQSSMWHCLTTWGQWNV